MNPKLNHPFQQLEDDRKRLVAEMTAQSPAVLGRHLSPEKWSINQILLHLLTSEELTLRYLKKKSQGVLGLNNSGPLESLKLGLLILSQRLPIKYQAPKQLLQLTPGDMPFAELASRWQQVRTELFHFLDDMPLEHIHKLIYKHPVAGRFDVIQCLIFMREHVRHHLPQIKRLL